MSGDRNIFVLDLLYAAHLLFGIKNKFIKNYASLEQAVAP